MTIYLAKGKEIIFNSTVARGPQNGQPLPVVEQNETVLYERYGCLLREYWVCTKIKCVQGCVLTTSLPKPGLFPKNNIAS